MSNRIIFRFLNAAIALGIVFVAFVFFISVWQSKKVEENFSSVALPSIFPGGRSAWFALSIQPVPEFQRHSPHDFEGTGAASAIVHKVVTKHDGRIWLREYLV